MASTSKRSTQVLSFNRRYFRDAFAVTLFAFGRRQPFLNDFAHPFELNHTPAQGENIGVIVLATVSRRRHVIAHRGAHTGDLVRGHTRTDPRAIDDYPEIALPAGNSARDIMSEIRVIHRIG